MLKELVSLQHMMEDRTAAKDFAEAMRRFHEECPAIPKNRKVGDTDRAEGSRFGFSYADLEQLVKIVRPILFKHGFSFTFDTEDVPGKVKVTCILKHIGGHKETASYTALDISGSMNASQKHTGAFTTGRRIALSAVLGVTDTEGEPSPAQDAGNRPITSHQAANLRGLLEETKTDVPKFLRIYAAKSVEELPAINYKAAMDMLAAKQKGAKS
jgi:hypothetical protein